MGRTPLPNFSGSTPPPPPPGVNSPAAKKPAKEASPAKSLKSLAFSGETSALSTSLQRHDEILSRLNVDNLPNDGVKIVYLNPSGNV